MKIFLLSIILYFGFFSLAFAQKEVGQEDKLVFKSLRLKTKKRDSILSSATNYKIISWVRDTISVDTTLTIHAEYEHNPIRKDMFEYLSLSNMGQAYTRLGYSFRNTDVTPEMGATANNYYYIAPSEVPYFYLPTPMTQFFYKSGMEQGQSLHSLFSANITPNLNLFIRYNAMRSLGHYQNILSSIGNFIGGFSYSSKNKRYWFLGHYANQDIERQENGGLLLAEQFESGDSQFLNRGGVDVAFTDAGSNWEAKRYFFTHQYNFLRQENKINSQILLKHIFSYETKKYSFHQALKNNYFGESFIPSEISDKFQYKTLVNQLGAELVLPYLGQTFVYGKSYFYNYFSNKIFFDISGNKIPNKISDTDYGVGLSWRKKYRGFGIQADAEQMFIGTLLGSQFSVESSYDFNEKNKILLGFKLRSAMPNFNKLLYQNSYKNYNWYHLGEFSRENYQTLFADVQTQWGNASIDISNINNYTYFQVDTPISNERSQSKPVQFSGNIQFLKLKLQKEFRLGKFALDNTIMYQEVIQDKDILNVPRFSTRNSLYFSSFVFKKAMFLQFGVGVRYFTDYYADRYNPLLAEFEVQQQEKIGNYPLFDVFLNAKVRTMRIFLKYEHFNSPFSERNYYVAPAQPFRDATLRLGIIWNFFS